MAMHDVWYIVAGGPSLIGFDWRSLDGRHVIAVNRAFEKLPRADVVYFTDHRFWTWHHEGLLDHGGRLITGAAPKHASHPRLCNWKLTGTRGLDTRYCHLRHGNNSGYAAINVAYHMGARRIYLFGFDFRYSAQGQSHWHDDHPSMHRERVFTKMLPHFDSLARDLRLRGIGVWNTSPDSALTDFPVCSIEDALSDRPPGLSVTEALCYPMQPGAYP